jgi:hypothetical protein
MIAFAEKPARLFWMSDGIPRSALLRQHLRRRRPHVAMTQSRHPDPTGGV